MVDEPGTPATMPVDVAELVEARVDPARPRIADPAPPGKPPAPPAPPAPVDTAPAMPWYWYAAIGLVIVGVVTVAYLELRERFRKEE